MGKCELACVGCREAPRNHAAFPQDIKVADEGGFKFLGAGIGEKEFCEAHTAARVRKAEKLLQALAKFPDMQTAILLLRQCAAFCKLSYSCRAMPGNDQEQALAVFDGSIRASFEDITSTCPDDEAWEQAKLAIKKGGIGLRACSEHASAAYLASRAGTDELCRKLDPARGQQLASPAALNSALADYNGRVAQEHQLREQPFNQRQQHLSSKVDGFNADRMVEEAAADPVRQAHLQVLREPGAGHWLQAPPSEALGLNLPPPLYQIALKRRLRMQLFEQPEFCPRCSEVMDLYGDHALVCRCGGDIAKRHNAIRNCIFFRCAAGGLNPERERPGLLPARPEEERQVPAENRNEATADSSLRRPADVYIPRWRSGVPAALDFAVTSALRSDRVSISSSSGSAAVRQYAEYKCAFENTRRQCQDAGIDFVPVVFEAHSGAMEANARTALYRIAKAACPEGSDTDINSSVERTTQHVSIILQKENARAVLRRLVSLEAMREEHLNAEAHV